MRYYIKEAEPVFMKEERVEDLFRVKAWLIYALTSARDDQEVLAEVNTLKELSDEMGFPEGKDMANQALADFYLETGFLEEGIELYEEILRGQEERDAPIINRVNIIRHLLNKGEKVEVRKFYLEKLAVYIRECERIGMVELDDDTSLQYVKYLYHRSYTQLGLDLRDLRMVSTHLKETKRIAKEGQMDREAMSILNLELLYYMLAKEYSKSLLLVDSLIDFAIKNNRVTSLLKFMQNKADIYLESGQGNESAKMYREYVSLKDSVTNATFYESLAKLRSRHDVDKLELKNKQMALDAAQTHSQLLVMGGGLAFLALLCCSLGYISYSRHRYGKQLKKAKERAEETDRLKSAFLANMNHEIRTPLNAIVGFSQVLVEENDPAARQEYADIIANNNELLQRLIGDVLDISKVESNTMEFTYSDVDMPAMMKEIYSVMSLRIPAGVEFRMDSCPAFIFHTDRNRLTQILTNFLTNASKHTEKGYICFGYEFIETGQVRFYVKDSGEGIPDEQLDRIFTRFVKLTEWTKGVGLGLAISKALVTHLGGHIEVESKVGVGSTFSVIFPINK